MQNYRNILVASDGAGSDVGAFTQALSLARNTGAALSALIVCPALPTRLADYAEAYQTSLLERVRASCDEARSTLGLDESAIPVSMDLESGALPGERIVRRVLRNGHDLVLKQCDRAGRSEGLPAIDMRLLRICPCPVWLCRPIERHREEMRIAVAIDPHSEEPAGRDLSLNLLTMSRGLADMCSGELTVISCWDYEYERFLLRNSWHRVEPEEVRRVVVREQAEHLQALDLLIRESGVGDVRLRHVRGAPDQTIPNIAHEDGVDVLVMGTVARTGVPGFIMGNTAENIVRRLGCSLVALKPPGFVSPVRTP